MQHRAVQCSTVQCSAVQISVQCSTVECSAVQFSVVQYSLVQWWDEDSKWNCEKTSLCSPGKGRVDYVDIKFM